jgi:hypothetical protein
MNPLLRAPTPGCFQLLLCCSWLFLAVPGLLLAVVGLPWAAPGLFLGAPVRDPITSKNDTKRDSKFPSKWSKYGKNINFDIK